MTDFLGPYELGPGGEMQGIYTGDARELAKAIPDESLDLIFTDPIYDRIADYQWLAEMSLRILKDGGDVLVYLAHYHLASVLHAMVPPLLYRWMLVEKKISSGALIWTYRLFSHYIPMLWLTKGSPQQGLSRIDFQWGRPNGRAVNHPWSKNAGRMVFWLARFVNEGAIVYDPFGGGGAIMAAAKLAGHRYLGFEIDPATAEAARERIRNTQPPLFVPEAEQLAMGALQ